MTVAFVRGTKCLPQPDRHTQPPSERIEPYVWKIAGVVILGMMMSILDTTIVNVALHTLGTSCTARSPRSSGW